MKTFETGATYFFRFANDASTRVPVTIEKRTPSSVWIHVDGKLVRRGVRVFEGVEYCLPYGNYSMCPRLTAERIYHETA